MTDVVHVFPSPAASGLDDAAAREPGRGASTHASVDVRSGSLALIAVLLGVFALRWAAEIVIPVLMALLFSYALTPVVDLLGRLRIPRALGAAVVMAAIVGGLAWATSSLSDQANSVIRSLPDAARKLRDTLHAKTPVSGDTAMAQVQKAAATLEQAAADGSAARAAPGIAKVQIVKPAFDLRDDLFAGTMHAAAAAAQAAVVACITYFLLAAGDTFRRKLAKIAGPSFAKRKITVQALDEISEQVRRYLLVQFLLSAAVGAGSALAFGVLGFNNAAVWGVLAGVMNLIPYVGMAAVCGASAVVALLQFGTIQMALVVGGVTIVMHGVAGYLVAPWLLSRTSRLNAVVVFVGVLAWGWLWGVWGLLLGTPILMAVKAVCDRVEDLKPVGELLGGTDKALDRIDSRTINT